jgi:hypothetical protein
MLVDVRNLETAGILPRSAARGADDPAHGRHVLDPDGRIEAGHAGHAKLIDRGWQDSNNSAQ